MLCKVSEGAGKAFPCLVSSGLVAPVTNTFVGSLVQGVGGGVGGGSTTVVVWRSAAVSGRNFVGSSARHRLSLCVQYVSLLPSE